MKRSPIVNPDEPKKNDVNMETLADVYRRLQNTQVTIHESVEKMRDAIFGMSRPLTKNDVALTNPTTGETNEENTAADPSTRQAKEPQDHLPPRNPSAGRGKRKRHRR